MGKLKDWVVWCTVDRGKRRKQHPFEADELEKEIFSKRSKQTKANLIDVAFITS